MASLPVTLHTPAATIHFTGGDDDSSSVSSSPSTDSLQIITHDEEQNVANNNQRNNSTEIPNNPDSEEAASQSSGETSKMKESTENMREKSSRSSTFHSSSEERMQRSIQSMAEDNRTKMLNNNDEQDTQPDDTQHKPEIDEQDTQSDDTQLKPEAIKRQSSSPQRFNPFDKEEYDPNQRVFPQADQSGTSSSGSDQQDSDILIAEDHFAVPEGHVGVASIEELELAINNIKLMILEAEEHSTARRELVQKLVELRLKLAEAQEEPAVVDEGVKLVVGHRFDAKNNTRTKHYCESCNSVIWGVLHEWYRCTECGFHCHAKCLNAIKRTCASVKVAENPSYILSITPEKGLSQQNYRCAECKTPISFDDAAGAGEPRQCEYSGLYFCAACHWNDAMVIPALVLHNWDFEPRKVCRASKQFLKLMSGRAVIQVCDINPMLFSFVEELNDVKRLREEILIMKKYFLTCKTALETKLLLQLRDRQHFVEGSEMYSLQDLQDVMDDVLLPSLAKIHASFAQHIKTDCKRCQGQGYICELCDYDEVLFPFDNHALVCAQCSTVIHRHCYIQRGHRCPKCERRDRRHQEQLQTT